MTVADLWGDEVSLGLADIGEKFSEPGLIDIEGLTPGNPGELDRTQFVISILVLTNHTTLAAQGAVDGQVGARTDELQVRRVRGG